MTSRHPAGSVRILDTTLREGEQAPGVCFTLDQKVAMARLLCEAGVEIIEAGNPIVSPEIAKTVTMISREGLRANVAAQCRCLRRDVEAALDCGVGLVGVFLAVSTERLRGQSLRDALVRIEDVISRVKALRPDVLVRYTLEDAVRAPDESVLQAASTAVAAGADIISIADTTGYMLPVPGKRNFGEYVRWLKASLAERKQFPEIAVHCHNDRGLALANALQACVAGASIVDTSVMGLGERAGIVDLASFMTGLGDATSPRQTWRLDRLPALYEAVSQWSGRAIPVASPIVGRYAFSHYAGVHVHAVVESPWSYQSLDPGQFGRDWSISLGVQSGRESIRYALGRLGREDLIAHESFVAALLAEVKARGEARRDAVDLDTEFAQLVDECESRSRRLERMKRSDEAAHDRSRTTAASAHEGSKGEP